MTFRGRNGHRWAQIRGLVMERDGFRCRSCGRRGHLEVDHVVPVQRRGSDDLGNLQALCVRCHKRKTAADRHGRDATMPGKAAWLERVDDGI